MSSVVIAGDTSGSVTLAAPAVAGTTTLTLPTISGGTLVTSDSSGNVGIGTTSPTAKVQANATYATTWNTNDSTSAGYTPQANELAVINNQNATTNSWSGLFFQGGQASTNTQVHTARIACLNDGTTYGGTLAVATRDGSTGNSVERMRIDSSGNVLIGQTTNSQSGRLVIKGSAGSDDDLVINTNASYAELQSFNSKPLILNRQGNNLYFGTSTSSVAGGAITFFNPQAINTYINVGHKTGSTSGASFYVASYNGVQIGDIAQSGTTAVVYNTTSDYRLKEDVKPIENALDRVSKLKPVTYKWKNADNEFGEGYLAHELAEVCPLAVTGEKDAVNEDGSIKPQNVDYSKVVALLSASIKELKAIVDAQQQEINALKGAA